MSWPIKRTGSFVRSYWLKNSPWWHHQDIFLVWWAADLHVEKHSNPSVMLSQGCFSALADVNKKQKCVVKLNDEMCVCVCWPQKRQPLPLSPQNYPLHGSDVNIPASFHNASAGYGVPNHTPPINGTESIMGKTFHPDSTTDQSAAVGFTAVTCCSLISAV